MSEAVVPAAASQLFEQDDQETLDLLLQSSSSDDDDMQNRLTETANRFRNDCEGENFFWKTISKAAEELGFRISSVSSAAPSTAAQPDSSSSFPAAFETESGKKHIQATCSFLRISKTRAVQLTLSALTSLNAAAQEDDEESHIQSLLGTRDLFQTVREYYYQQRTARLQVLTECLRVEQDEDSPFYQECKSMLDTLDNEYSLDGRHRGLFQRLLTIACAPYSPPTRDELLPTLELTSETNLPEKLDTFSSDDSFVTECFQASRLQTQRERVQAMEALLVLLYHRIDQGIHRIDFILVLLAFQSCGTFFTTSGGIQRLSYLAGLICAECMSLWMTTSTEQDASGVPLWIVRHPVLVGVVESDGRAVHEMEALLMLLTKYASQVAARKLQGMVIRSPNGGDVDAPESIALYSFALLLRLVQINVPSGQEAQSNTQQRFDFENHGMECAQTAVDDCGVFDYLHATMEALVKTPIRDSFSSVSNIPYDWQFSKDSSPLVLEGPSEQEELNAANVAYSSIGLEILSATIIAFQSTIRTGNCISLENVNMLCSLAATIYGNHPLLCEAFWKNLEAYTSAAAAPRQDAPLASNQALCYLVDAAHACAASALNAVALASMEDTPGLEENILPSLVPLLQLMSSLCSSSGMVESVLKLLPKGMIRIALLCCAPTSSVKDAAAFSNNALQIVKAIQDLARVGRSSNCRTMLRSALEEEGSDTLDGPRVLFRIISAQPSTDIVSSTLRIVGYFVESATGHELWVAKAAKYLGPYGLGENGLAALLTGQSSSSVALSALHVLNGLVGNLAAIAFCPLCEQTDILDVFYVVMNGVTSSNMLLTTLLSSTPNQIPETGKGISYLVAHGVLRCSAMLFRSLRPIIYMHKYLRVKAAAKEVLSTHSQNLSTSTPVGQAIAYFASAPVSMSLAIMLEEMMQSANVMQIASDEYARETEPLDFGAWRSITDASREIKPAVETAKVREYGQNLVSNIHELGIDLQGFQSKGWTDESTAMEPLLAASAALDLLRLWSLAVDDTVGTSLDRTAASDLEALSPCRLIFSQIEKPPIVEGSSSLGQVWPKTLTLFDVLLRYLEGADEEMPSLLAADVLSLTLVTSKEFDQSLQVPFTDIVIRCSSELSLVLKEAITNVGGLTSGAGQQGELSREQDMQIRKGLASLRLLSICMGLDGRVVDAVCGAETSPLNEAVSILSSTASLIRNGLTLEKVASDPLRTSKLRAASSSIHVLLSLWKSSCAKHASQNVSGTIAAFKRSVIGDLVTIVEFAGRILSTATVSAESSYAHVVALLTAASSDALEILTVAMSTELGEPQDSDKCAKTTVVALVKDSFPSLSDAFSKIDSAVSTAQSWSKLEWTMNSLKQVGVHDPRSILCSFPATYRSQMESHQSQENLCDLVAASSWVLPLCSAQKTSEEALKECNTPLILLSKQLALVKSWGQFATMSSLVEENDTDIPVNVLLSRTRAVLSSLGHIAAKIEEAQMLVSENYLPLDVGAVADVLASLLVQTTNSLSKVACNSQTVTSIEIANLLGMLQELSITAEKLLSTCINRPSQHAISLVVPSYLEWGTNKIREDSYFMCCSLQKRLLSAAILMFSTLDQIPSPFSPTDEDQQVEVALKFVETACKGLELAGNLSRSHDDRSACLSRELLEASVSLLTVLLAKERGPLAVLTGETQFYATVVVLIKRSKVMESLVSSVDIASKSAVVTAPKEETHATPVLESDENQVQIVQTIFNFIRTVAEIGKKSDDMLSLLSSAGVSKMFVDNPLLIAANQAWVSKRNANDQLSAAFRGYLPLKGKMPVDVPEGDSRAIVTGTFLSGKDDPVHLAWRTALKIMEAIVHAYARPRDTTHSTSRHFLDTAIAFLRMYYTSLIACLEQCSSLSSDGQRRAMPGSTPAAHTSHIVLTFNALCEAADILALVSALCSGTHLQMFENVCYDIYHGMILACHTVLDGLSEFLAASGTAREIFAAMKDYDIQLQQESANRDGFGFGEAQVDVNPLLTGGIPNAKHEAIKHAHYANRCCALVTSEDYKGLSSASSSSGGSPFSTSSLERDSQLSLNSPFMARMEYTAAGCVSTVIKVLSETHPASSCFVMFSLEEVRDHDMLSLLRKGMIISAVPEPESSSVCQFYRILHVDTVRRKCHVRNLDKSVDQAEETLDVERVNGVEDISKRRPVLAFSAAPTSFAELESAVVFTENTASLGDVISVLRWCYQCTGDDVVDSDHRKSIRNVLAENASALLSTEVSLHEEVGTFSLTTRDELSKRVMSQLLQLFDQSNTAPRWSGRLKQIVGPSVWNAVQQQLGEELRMARNDRREKKMQNMKKAAAVSNGGPSPWFSSAGREHAGGAQQMPGFHFESR